MKKLRLYLRIFVKRATGIATDEWEVDFLKSGVITFVEEFCF